MSIEIDPVLQKENLIEIYRRLPVDTLVAEEERLRSVCSEVMGRLIAINNIREREQYDQHTLFD